MLNTVKVETEHGQIAYPLDHCPDLLALHKYNPERYPFLLESTSCSGKLGRYDILFAFPGQQIVQSSSSSRKFLHKLESEWLKNKVRPTTPQDNQFVSPFTGGWFLFLSYELAAEIENLPAVKTNSNLPIATATRIPLALVYDHASNKTWIVAEGDYPGVQQMIATVRNDLKKNEAASSPDIKVISLEEDAKQDYLDAVVRIKEYIRDGDIFQANLSRQWTARLNPNIKSHHLYSRLRKTNPSPFSGIARIDSQTTIISSSPERLVEVRQGEIVTRPIAGTYPRASDPEKDTKQSSELLAHPKERAEHIMLIDLERNDLGRICVPGSIQVPELMVLESYEHVHHIVSEVRGKLRPNIDPAEVIAATFPGGTITGCPKVRCMEIISDLETTARGAYTGSFGYLNLDGSLDLNILIRTMTQHGDELSFRAGAGIVADSDPAREFAETQAKAEGLLRALR